MEISGDIQQRIEKLYEILKHPTLEAEHRKLEKKIEEIKYNLGDIHPVADCILIILLLARRQGFSVEAVLKALDEQSQTYLKREWKQMPDGTYQSFSAN